MQEDKYQILICGTIFVLSSYKKTWARIFRPFPAIDDVP